MMTDKPFSTNYNRVVAVAASCGAILVCLIVGITLVNGTGYQDFESIRNYRTVDEYAARLATSSSVLRAIYPLDTLYIFAYLIMVFAMVLATGQTTPVGILACVAALGTASLDFIENNHILAMAAAVERGYEVSMGRVTFETVITQTKFNFGLLLTLCLSFLLPGHTKGGLCARWLARALVVLAPVALLSPIATLAYISMNILFAGIIAAVFFQASSSNM
ncbi:hypothetical protein [Cognatishimia sp. 1_MG-2023]|uniref:hypothetical protein n=1 Tax=Cognatishimia sp. 1_MG-2023 TaxID=3062642 RepID=UPI0026E2D57F|nr:hypothetical protein [Cognatishimia sp. 1_MG-2023]